jgi:hypothetical protein
MKWQSVRQADAKLNEMANEQMSCAVLNTITATSK